MTIPCQSPFALSIEILVIIVCSWAIQFATIIRYSRVCLEHPFWWLAAIYWVLPGFFFSFIAGVISSWVLLIRVGLQKQLTLKERLQSLKLSGGSIWCTHVQ